MCVTKPSRRGGDAEPTGWQCATIADPKDDPDSSPKETFASPSWSNSSPPSAASSPWSHPAPVFNPPTFRTIDYHRPRPRPGPAARPPRPLIGRHPNYANAFDPNGGQAGVNMKLKSKPMPVLKIATAPPRMSANNNNNGADEKDGRESTVSMTSTFTAGSGISPTTMVPPKREWSLQSSSSSSVESNTTKVGDKTAPCVRQVAATPRHRIRRRSGVSDLSLGRGRESTVIAPPRPLVIVKQQQQQQQHQQQRKEKKPVPARVVAAATSSLARVASAAIEAGNAPNNILACPRPAPTTMAINQFDPIVNVSLSHPALAQPVQHASRRFSPPTRALRVGRCWFLNLPIMSDPSRPQPDEDSARSDTTTTTTPSSFLSLKFAAECGRHPRVLAQVVVPVTKLDQVDPPSSTTKRNRSGPTFYCTIDVDVTSQVEDLAVAKLEELVRESVDVESLFRRPGRTDWLGLSDGQSRQPNEDSRSGGWNPSSTETDIWTDCVATLRSEIATLEHAYRRCFVLRRVAVVDCRSSSIIDDVESTETGPPLPYEVVYISGPFVDAERDDLRRNVGGSDHASLTRLERLLSQGELEDDDGEGSKKADQFWTPIRWGADGRGRPAWLYCRRVDDVGDRTSLWVCLVVDRA